LTSQPGVARSFKGRDCIRGRSGKEQTNEQMIWNRADMTHGDGGGGLSGHILELEGYRSGLLGSYPCTWGLHDPRILWPLQLGKMLVTHLA
jgi:hypothetical protein